MTTPFLGEIKIMSFNFAPKGWALCNGQTLQINTNQALFSLFGTMYGGDGQRTFNLPNLVGRVAAHMGQGWVQGQQLGEVSHTITSGEMASHNHVMVVSATGALVSLTGLNPSGHMPAQAKASTNPVSDVNIWGTGGAAMTFAPTMIGNSGGNQPHANQQPYLVLNFCVALQGIYPSRT
jgi:microcystin-dependent protein